MTQLISEPLHRERNCDVTDELAAALPTPGRMRLGELLVHSGSITQTQLADALARQARSGQLLGRVLIDQTALKPEDLAQAVQRLFSGFMTSREILQRMGMPNHHIQIALERQKQFHEPLSEVMRDWGLLSQEQVAKVIAIEHGLDFLPWSEIDDVPIESLLDSEIRLEEFRGFVPIALVRAHPRVRISIVISDIRSIAEATSQFRDYECHFHVASSATCQVLYRRHFARTAAALTDLMERHFLALRLREDLTQSGLYQDMFMALLRHACYTGASDLCLYRSHRIGMIKLKTDGIWALLRSVPTDLLDQMIGVMRNSLLSGVADEKLLCGFTECSLDLNTSRNEHAVRIRDRYADIVERYVFRVEIGNAVQGKTVTIRINDRQSTAVELNQLGFDTRTLHLLLAYMRSRSGVLLICGPTGSGKTTTLYALLQSVDPVCESIQTVESPVEYTHGLWQQFPLSPGLNKDEGDQWALALKGLLRNAPDKILFGEVRDENTARELFRAANTGHLVLSTLHTNGAAEAIRRLEDLAVPGEKAASILLGVLAQRLVRKLCVRCKVPDERQSTYQLLAPLGQRSMPRERDPIAFRAADNGCGSCGHTGYRGRRMIYELLHCGKKLRDQLETAAPLSALRKAMEGNSMRDNALALVAEGLTSIDELCAHIDLEA